MLQEHKTHQDTLTLTISRRWITLIGVALGAGIFVVLVVIWYTSFAFPTQRQSLASIMTPPPNIRDGAPILPTSPPLTSIQIATPTSIQTEILPITVQPQTTIRPPDSYGFTNRIELKGTGVSALFPPDTSMSTDLHGYYFQKSNGLVQFEFLDYDGTGRRAWFQKTFPYTKGYTFTPFTVDAHEGYLAYPAGPTGTPGDWYYFTAMSPKVMLVISESSSVDNVGFFFSANLERMKSFLSGLQFSNVPNVMPSLSKTQSFDNYRTSDTRRSVWRDSDLGIQITVPEWVEWRLSKGIDNSTGRITYGEWERNVPSSYVDIRHYAGTSATVVHIENQDLAPITAITILSPENNSLSYHEVARKQFVGAGFCGIEYRRELQVLNPDTDPLAHIIMKRQYSVAGYSAQLVGLQTKFSEDHDCRDLDVWIFKAKNGQYVLTTHAGSIEKY